MTKAVILAAGEGKRLRPLTINTPKSLVEISGDSLINRQIKLLASRGIVDIVIIAGFKHTLFDQFGFPVIVNKEYASTNMVYSLSCALRYLCGDTIITYGDIIYSPSVLDDLLASPAPISLTIDMNWKDYWYSRSEFPLSDLESLSVNDNGNITDIGSKPSNLDQIEGQYMGLSFFRAEGLHSMLPLLSRDSLVSTTSLKPISTAYMTDLFQALINLGYPIKSVPIYSPWIEIDTLDDYHSPETAHRLSLIDLSLKNL